MTLWILDENLMTVDVISQYESLAWEKKWFVAGGFQVVAADKYESLTAGKRDPTKVRYVYRPDSDYIGRIDNITYDDGKIIARGKFLEGLLAFRAETFRMTYSGPVEAVARDIVNQNCIANKPIPYLTLGVNKNAGESVNATLFGRVILDYLLEMASVYGNSYNIKYDRTLHKLVFDVLWGIGRTQDQVVNEWCLFGQQWGNVISEQYETNTDYANFATVYGEGEDANRIYDTVDIRAPGEELREISVDARDLRQGDLSLADYKATLRDRGLKKLGEQGKYENILADVRVSSDMPYSLGDIVAYRHERTGVVFNLRITEEKETYDGKSYVRKVTFGERQGGVMAAVKTMFV